ncbi:hypothetical protein BHE74_00009060 [Ensete ventricosum]|nr:hypothetical protein BHE74_00009060 [Ensete ventricosum]
MIRSALTTTPPASARSEPSTSSLPTPRRSASTSMLTQLSSDNYVGIDVNGGGHCDVYGEDGDRLATDSLGGSQLRHGVGDDEVNSVLLVEAGGVAMRVDLIIVEGNHAIHGITIRERLRRMAFAPCRVRSRLNRILHSSNRSDRSGGYPSSPVRTGCCSNDGGLGAGAEPNSLRFETGRGGCSSLPVRTGFWSKDVKGLGMASGYHRLMIRSPRTRVLNSAWSRPFPPPIQRCRRVSLRCFSSLRRLSPAFRVFSGSHHPSAKLLPPFSSPSRSRRRSPPPPMEPADDSSVVSDPSSAEDYVHVSEPAADEPAPNPNLAAHPVLDSGILFEASSGGGSAGGERSAEEGAAEGKRVLPEELAKGVLSLQCESSAEGGSCDVYVVGTAHVSQESCKEVQAIISYLKPQLEVFPGSEFRVAFEEAMSYGGKVILGDRPVQLKEMDDVDMLTLFIQEMSKAFPTLMETLLHERDMLLRFHSVPCFRCNFILLLSWTCVCRYMSSTLLKVAREHSSVVAVVGKGHLSGIKKKWEQPIEVSFP